VARQLEARTKAASSAGGPVGTGMAADGEAGAAEEEVPHALLWESVRLQVRLYGCALWTCLGAGVLGH